MSEKSRKTTKNSSKTNYHPFPTLKTSVGFFNGFSVEVFDEENVKNLYEDCFYGKGSFSRSTPQCLRNSSAQKLTDNQLKMRKDWKNKFEEESEDPETKKRRICTEDTRATSEAPENPYNIKESLDLFLEEAFFLHYSLNCLTIKDLNQQVIPTRDLWKQFCAIKYNFITCFVAYLYMKSKNWVIRTGIKFGGDFLLYKESPSVVHSAYIVIVRKAGEKTDPDLLKSLYRISETTGKEIIFLDVFYPDDTSNNDPESHFENLSKFKVLEATPARFSLTNS